MNQAKDLSHIGKAVLVDIVGHATNVHAKVDTGADSSSLWASDIHIGQDGVLYFKLFDQGSEHYTGEQLSSSDFTVAMVRSSTGHEQVRYQVALSIRIADRRVKAKFNLSDRSKNKFPILIGRRTLSGKFLVDVRSGVPINKVYEMKSLNEELRKDPYKFFKKYHDNRKG